VFGGGTSKRQETDFTRARLTAALLRDADFYSGADFTGADLTGAILLGADLSAAKFVDTKLESLCYTRTTRWPASFIAPLPDIQACS
jgi:uncharacterized protein YjbI with pentapeptide repeats